MQLKRQTVEAWQNENYYSKENNTSENPILSREIFKSVDHVKYEGQPELYSLLGQVKSQHLLFVQFLVELPSCCVIYENCYKSLVF